MKRRVFQAVAAACCMAFGVVAVPDGVGAYVAQEDLPGNDGSGLGAIVEVDIDIDVSFENIQEVDRTLDELREVVADQLEAFDSAEAAVSDAISDLADIDLAIVELHFLLEELVDESDRVVADVFMNPPSAGALDLFTTETVADLALKQTLLELVADHDGDVLSALAAARDDVEEALETQEELQLVTQRAHADAAQALTDLENAMSKEAQFLLRVDAMLETGEIEGVPAGFEEDFDGLNTRLSAIEEATRVERERRQLEERAREEAASGAFICPVQPTSAVRFTDTWGAPRSGGRSHQGTDMFAAHGTATVAPVDGRVEHRGTSLGGLSWYVYGDNGTRYYGTHLQSYESQGAGWVRAGTTIGYVGSSGNASSTSPHLHFEIHPGGGAAVNPYPQLVPAC